MNITELLRELLNKIESLEKVSGSFINPQLISNIKDYLENHNQPIQWLEEDCKDIKGILECVLNHENGEQQQYMPTQDDYDIPLLLALWNLSVIPQELSAKLSHPLPLIRYN